MYVYIYKCKANGKAIYLYIMVKHMRQNVNNWGI